MHSLDTESKVSIEDLEVSTRNNGPPVSQSDFQLL